MPHNSNYGPPVEPALVNARGQRVEKYDQTSPADTNVAPPPAPPEPEHIIMTKSGVTRRILKAEATPEIMAAHFWEPWHPTDYTETNPKRKTP